MVEAMGNPKNSAFAVTGICLIILSNANTKEKIIQKDDSVHTEIFKDHILSQFAEVTELKIRPLSFQERESLFKRVPPYDKAGAFSISESPEIIQYIKGLETNVRGLPIERIEEETKKLEKYLA
jgi:predicted house-cleaning NTP pyrophosphatase (Maf/HAM1 superfamily)